MLKTVFKVTLLVLWLTSTAWLVRYEAFPHVFDGTLQGYRDLANDLPAMRDTWMKVYAGGEHVGYLNSSIEMEEAEGREELTMTTQLVLRILFQGRPETLRFTNDVRLNARHELLQSDSGFSLAALSGDLLLKPMEKKGDFELQIEINGMKLTRMVTVPEEAVISSPMMDQGLRSVKPGQVLRIRTLDPFSMSGELQTVEIRGISRKIKSLPGESQELEVTRVETHFGDLVLESEVDQFGRALWQQTPFGLSFLISQPQEAMKIPDQNAVDPAELLSSSLFSNLLPGGDAL